MRQQAPSAGRSFPFGRWMHGSPRGCHAREAVQARCGRRPRRHRRRGANRAARQSRGSPAPPPQIPPARRPAVGVPAVPIVSFTGKEIDASIRWVLGVAQSMRSGGSKMGSDGLLDGRCSMKTGPIECIEGSLVVSRQSRDCFLSCGRGAPQVHRRPDPGPGGPCGPSPACATGWILSPGRYGGCFTSHIRKKKREHAFLKLVAKAGSRPLELGGSATTLAPLH